MASYLGKDRILCPRFDGLQIDYVYIHIYDQIELLYRAYGKQRLTWCDIRPEKAGGTQVGNDLPYLREVVILSVTERNPVDEKTPNISICRFFLEYLLPAPS